MNLLKLLESHSTIEVYHATNARFTKFLPRPTWFSLNKKDAKGWHHSGASASSDSITYVCEFTGKIATEEQAEETAKQVWPDESFLYSMFDVNVGEYDEDDIKKFIKLLQNEGFDASYLEDYDPADFNSGSSRSLCVFNPERSVQIKSSIDSFKYKPPVKTISVGDKVWVYAKSDTMFMGVVKSVSDKGYEVEAKGLQTKFWPLDKLEKVN